MAYRVYVSKLLLPLAPAKISFSISNRNETVDLINGGEVNILRAPGLTDIEMEVLLPSQAYPFADYIGGFIPIQTFLKKFEALKTKKKPFDLLISRKRNTVLYGKKRVAYYESAAPVTNRVVDDEDGSELHGTSIKVTLEEYEVVDDEENGADTLVSLSFKQHKEYGTQKTKTKLPCTYKTKKGDTLVKIAKTFYGKSSYWTKVYKANKNMRVKDKKRGVVYLPITKRAKRSLMAGIKLTIPE